jgi:hypothetical protein
LAVCATVSFVSAIPSHNKLEDRAAWTSRCLPP